MNTKMTSNITNSIQTIILAIITIIGFYLVFKQIKNLETKFQKNKKENDEIINNIFNLINNQNLNVCDSYNNLPEIKNNSTPSTNTNVKEDNIIEKKEPIKEWNNEEFMIEDYSSSSDSESEKEIPIIIKKNENNHDSEIKHQDEDEIDESEQDNEEQVNDHDDDDEVMSNHISENKYNKDELSILKIKDIKDICRDLNIPVTGSKEFLINKILNI